MKSIILVFLILNGFINMKASDKIDSMKEELITLGSGCFWCAEAIYESVKGVNSVVSGYSGGTIAGPSYKEVTTGSTGHAEVVQIAYNPDIISFEELLLIFFKTHDPTTLNRQGADIGTQYRSVIFYHSEDQKQKADALIKSLEEQHIYENPIVTIVKKYDHFYMAEEHHQGYFAKNPYQGYCNAVIQPKLNKFMKDFSKSLK